MSSKFDKLNELLQIQRDMYAVGKLLSSIFDDYSKSNSLKVEYGSFNKYVQDNVYDISSIKIKNSIGVYEAFESLEYTAFQAREICSTVSNERLVKVMPYLDRKILNKDEFYEWATSEGYEFDQATIAVQLTSDENDKFARIMDLLGLDVSESGRRNDLSAKFGLLINELHENHLPALEAFGKSAETA